MKTVHISTPASIEAEFREAAATLGYSLPEAIEGLAADLETAIRVGNARRGEYDGQELAVISTRIPDELHATLGALPGPISRHCSTILISHSGQMRESLETRLADLSGSS